MSGEQKIRVFLFYLGLSIFLIGLPVILSFALSYKFNPRTLRFAKAGLVALKTQPAGASVYLNGKLLNDKTPTTINELLPGNYSVKLELEKYYPWEEEVNVLPGQVARLDKIIFFPLRPNIQQLNIENVAYFWLEPAENSVYYINKEGNVIYKSALDGDNFKAIASIPMSAASFKKWKISPDKEKLLCFNSRQIAVVYLKEPASRYFILDYAHHRINDIFWHSDSYHLILFTDRDIEVLEADPKTSAVTLATLNKNNMPAFYNERTDTLYFFDSEKAQDGEIYDNVYKLELNVRFSPFKELMRRRDSE